ncbi:hypothetical protein N7491_006727 [Penicillium cf. griseofulvum]|uniref:Methyltransferase domain-containing protein n=1 Tax=Penicillium cf. griseofulvum TaxID=2972120 RepID=A0A9W9IXL3_9EURO|nr:hypothetical protein N7472_010246 [Penicillium cf. griseofulvum]KAJ5429711.1 hypothetical protein N7491_006727 [Penicillium cf. griseofulvum]KAJ5436522.1 hypothetical protein N7445_007407 [Penicillium cf. griseofulvum]
MRVCLIQLSQGDVDITPPSDDEYPDPGLYTDKHTFKNRLVRKDRIKQDIDLTATENFDLFMIISGWHEDRTLGIQTVAYLEESKIPFVGLPSRIIERCIIQYCPAKTKTGLQIENLVGVDESSPGMTGDEYACTVVELGHAPVALSPVRRSQVDCLRRSSNPNLYDRICSLAKDAFHANDMHGCFWCTVLIRVTNEKPVLISINPMPQIFLRQISTEDWAIRESFPGSHRSLINSIIASCFLSRFPTPKHFETVGQEYDEVAPKYDAVTEGVYHDNVRKIATKYNYDGVVLDLACGTGLLARLKGEAQGLKPGDLKNLTKFIGVDLSAQMRTECLRCGWYERVLVGPMQSVLTTFIEAADHIVCIGALHYLNSNELSLVLSRVFQLARCSVTFTIDEIPESYIAAQRARGREFMHGINHVDEVNAYGIPVGWELADHWRGLGWKSPTTGDDVYIHVFRFERLDETRVLS